LPLKNALLIMGPSAIMGYLGDGREKPLGKERKRVKKGFEISQVFNYQNQKGGE
jgi:hypothetical protein